MASKEGQQLDTLPSQMYGYDPVNGIIRRIAVDETGRLRIVALDHGSLSGLADDDHPQYLLRTQAPRFTYFV